MSANDSLDKLRTSRRLLIEPIWEKPIDEIEGPLYQKYIQRNPDYDAVFVRSGVSRRIARAAENLPTTARLIVRAGHRPIEVQIQLLEMVKAEYLQKNPGASDSKALEFARTYVSDPSIKLPPHCCGAAVDVDVIDLRSGELIDFGCPVNTDDEIAFLDSDRITPQQRANRQMLVDAMIGAGFAPFKHEWWHFSYGDQTWADYYGKPGPIYGLIET